MPAYTWIPASEDWRLYSNIYNRATVFAPYTLPLDQRIVNEHLAPFCAVNATLCGAGVAGKAEAIIHASCYSGPGDVFGDPAPVGIIHVLLGNEAALAAQLLRRAEDWFRHHDITRLYTCTYHQNPYQFVLHGAEAYIWAGAYAAVNAFRHLNYDVELDNVCMRLPLTEPPAVFTPDLPPEMAEITWRESSERDDFLATTGKFEAIQSGESMGVCGYQYLKALSTHLHKGLGQFYISAAAQVHGLGIGMALLTRAHRKLYELGARQVNLVTNQSLYRAIQFYTKAGYQAEVIHGYWFSKTLEQNTSGV
jgi:GNAT superfamily N-acetyltransferase